jgi:hypothetical protein
VVGDRFVPETPFPFVVKWSGSSWSEVPVEDANELGVLYRAVFRHLMSAPNASVAAGL